MKDLWDSKTIVYIRHTNKCFTGVIAEAEKQKAEFLLGYFLKMVHEKRHSMKAQIKTTTEVKTRCK